MGVMPLGRMIGHVSGRWGAPSLMLSSVVHEARRVNPAHIHEAAFISLVLDGRYDETAAQRSFRYDRFSALYHPAELEHQDVVGAPGVRLLIFEFRPELLESTAVRPAHLRAMRDLSGTSAAWNLLSIYRDAAQRNDELDFEERALQLINDVASMPSRIPLHQPSLTRARDYLDAAFRRRLTMKEIADVAGIHPVYLGQMFHRQTGETIATCVSRLRVRAAAERLCSTSLPLAELALDHGFCDQSHFHRVFKKVSGLTPAAFRATFGAKNP
jgi:AraC family transcriptional regulator